jgi:uncharacterized protein (TIGR03663 family)
MSRSARSRRALFALLAVTALALLARLYALGWRVFHQDEGRVGAWILRYMETGAWEYRPIIHGPFIPHVNGVLFSAFEPTDFLARLPMAVVGGLLPLAAWLFRERLRETEIVALGVLLAANPVLLYYSRFMRNDVLLAAFAFFALGFAVRAYDADEPLLLLAAALSLALAFTTKENALTYPISWLGAGVLVLDARLLLAVREGVAPLDALASWAPSLGVGPARRRARSFALAGVAGVVAFALVFVAFYAPLPVTSAADALSGATLGTWEKLGTWLDAGMRDHAYPPYFIFYVKVLLFTSLPLTAFSAVGFLAERYTAGTPRPFVGFCFFWGVSALFGYPLITDITAAWSAAHILVPLAVPAAVGVALVWRLGAAALARDDGEAAAVAAAVLLLSAGVTGAVALDTSYRNSQSPTDDIPFTEGNIVVQYAQPAGEMQPVLRGIERSAPDNPGTDVLYYGDLLADNETWGEDPPDAWFDRLPLPWYTERANATTDDTTRSGVACGTDAPVVVALAEGAHNDPEIVAGDVEECLTERGYREVVYQQYQDNRPLHFFLAPGFPETGWETGTED